MNYLFHTYTVFSGLMDDKKPILVESKSVKGVKYCAFHGHLKANGELSNFYDVFTIR
jgi:hypothetical protein